MKGSFIYALLLPVLITFSSSVYGQKFLVNEEDRVLALEAQETFPDESFYAIESSVNIKFDFNSKLNQVEAKVKTGETLLCLSDLYQRYHGSIHLNEQTNSFRVSGKNYRGKPTTYITGESKYKSSGIFYDDITVKTFTIPFSRLGDRNSYSYTVNYEDVKYLTKSFFHTYYPRKTKTISYTIPTWLEVDLIEFNFEGFDIEKTESTDKYGNNVISYTLNDVKPIKNEKFSSGYSVSLPHIILVAKEYTQKGETETLFQSTADLYEWYASLTTSVENDPTDFNEKVNSLTASATSDEEKVERIFYWVQDNVRYIAYEDGIMGFKPATAQDVYNKKYGDCKGMANLTCEMLKVAGFDARLTWIGTRSIPYTYQTPSLAVDNHMICTLFLNDKKYFLDATEKGISMGDYAHRIQGQDVLIENGSEFHIDSVPNYASEHNLQKTTLELTLKDGILSGSGVNTNSGEESTQLYRYFKSIAEIDRPDKIEQYLANGNKNIKVTNIVTSDLDNRNVPVSLNFDMSIKNQVTSFDNEMYINTDFNDKYSDWDVEEDRINDLSFSHKLNEIKVQTIQLPSDYKVDYVPESINEDNADFKIMVDIKYIETNHKLEYTRELTVKNGNISASNVESWNSTITKLKAFYQDQTILLKK